jgi:hypothetical protein
MTEYNEKLADKLIESLDKCGWVEAIALKSRIDNEIKEIEDKARRSKLIEGAPRNAPLTYFLSLDEAAHLRELRQRKQMYANSIQISGECASREWEAEARQEGASTLDILEALGLKLATVTKVEKK